MKKQSKKTQKKATKKSAAKKRPSPKKSAPRKRKVAPKAQKKAPKAKKSTPRKRTEKVAPAPLPPPPPPAKSHEKVTYSFIRERWFPIRDAEGWDALVAQVQERHTKSDAEFILLVCAKGFAGAPVPPPPVQNWTKSFLSREEFLSFFWRGVKKLPKSPKVKKPKGEKVTRKTPLPPPTERNGVSLKEETSPVLSRRIMERGRPAEERKDFNSLLELFNRGVELVRKDEKTGRYIPVKVEKKATHRLVPTRWRHEEEVSSRALWTPTEVEFATSVCAEPLKLEKPSRPDLTIKHAYPRRGNVPVYKRDATEEGKRRVLQVLVKRMGASVKAKEVDKLPGEHLDGLYNDLVRASRLLRGDRELSKKMSLVRAGVSTKSE